MIQVDVQKLRELEAKATKGPWYSVRIEPTSATANHSHPYSVWIESAGPRAVQVEKSVCIHADDMDFIAAMRNALPSLLDEVERLRADANRLNQIEKRLWFVEPQYQNIPATYKVGKHLIAEEGKTLRAAIDAALGAGK